MVVLVLKSPKSMKAGRRENDKTLFQPTSSKGFKKNSKNVWARH